MRLTWQLIVSSLMTVGITFGSFWLRSPLTFAVVVVAWILWLFVWYYTCNEAAPKTDPDDIPFVPPGDREPPPVKPELTRRAKSLLALKSADGITVIDALRLIDRLEQETVTELAIFILESCKRHFENPGIGLGPDCRDLLIATFEVGADGGVSTGKVLHRRSCDVCGKRSPAARSEAAAGEWASDLGWLITETSDLCPEHKPKEVSEPKEAS